MTKKKKTIHPDDKIMRDPDMLASKMDDEYVMMSVEQGEYYGLDETGSRIWELLEEETTPMQIIETLTTEYDVPKDQCNEETMHFLNELYQKGLVKIN